jgi:hypothetical protein
VNNYHINMTASCKITMNGELLELIFDANGRQDRKLNIV